MLAAEDMEAVLLEPVPLLHTWSTSKSGHCANHAQLKTLTCQPLFRLFKPVPVIPTPNILLADAWVNLCWP